jgi:hypothetical protein
LIHAYADGAKRAQDESAVAEVRSLLRGVDWAEVRLTERPENVGLGRSILAGVTEVAAQHPAFLVWEDDLVCVPGTYAWLCAALAHYADDPEIFSVAGWTHPEIAPGGSSPYFDRRAESWVWGGYARSWRGMEEPAWKKLRACRARGVDPFEQGMDLVLMARHESARNLWAARWILHHVQHGGLCVRPPSSLVEHIGDDDRATNVRREADWENPLLAPAILPSAWPEPVTEPELGARWRRAVWRRLRPRQRLAAWFYRWL